MSSKKMIGEEEYLALMLEQGGKCAVCGCAPDPERALAIDHDHATGEVRGLLCTRCNLGLGYFGDDPARLLAARDYLLRVRAPHPLVGQWFLRIEDGRAEHQGLILAAAGEYVLVELYSWMTGEPTARYFAPEADVATEAWELFATDEAMRTRFGRYWSHVAERLDRVANHEATEVVPLKPVDLGEFLSGEPT